MGEGGSLQGGLAPIRVVCPVLEDVESFTQLRRHIQALVGPGRPLGERHLTFLVIDDSAGRDQAVDSLVAMPDVRVVRPPFNLGHQRAMVFGLRKSVPSLAPGTIVVSMDSDGEDRPEDLPALVAALGSDERPSIVLARRTARSENLQFKALYLVFRTVFRALTGTSIRTGNYAAFTAGLGTDILRHPNFDLCYSSTLVSLGLATAFVPCPRGTRYAGRSKMNVAALVMHGLRMLMPFSDRVAIRALATFGGAFFAGIGLSLVILGVRLFTSIAVPGWATYTLLLIAILSFVALANFMLLFVLIGQSRSISLSGIEGSAD